ncbi:MAG: hypothetical protein RMM29_01445 [Planctomycetota bacterium]|nr:hypothetical protein [Planctomycetota bacterium]MCX8040490.1 hypothetical protein [Planctomycetota bacterium]MDW8372301.1 hypothetical protein [Planctomycetota bacterium]
MVATPFWPAVIVGLALAFGAGCARPAAAPPSAEALVIAFVDDFHSGVIVARERVPAWVWPRQAADPWLVLHFGERRWISGEAHGVLPALRLAFTGGEGGVQIDCVSWWRHRRGGTDPDAVRLWVFTVSRDEEAALVRCLLAWIEAREPPGELWTGGRWWVSTRPWTLFSNCHDFTAELLAAAGIVVERPPIMQAAPLRAALDRAWAARQARGEGAVARPARAAH